MSINLNWTIQNLEEKTREAFKQYQEEEEELGFSEMGDLFFIDDECVGKIAFGAFDDNISIGIGDEIEGDEDEYGIVVGVIRKANGDPACYKVWKTHDEEPTDEDCFDYIQADHITLHEPCMDAEWSLGRIGYKRVSEPDGFCYLYNEETGDIAIW